MIVENYIRHNPNCTYNDIKRDTKIKIERVYKGMREAYKAADVSFSRNLTKRNLELQKHAVVNFIRNHPCCTVTEIQNNTRVCIPRVFGSILNAYRAADVPYEKKEITSGVQNPFVVKRCHAYEKQVVRHLKHFGRVAYHVRTPAGTVDCLFVHNDKTFVVEIKDFRARNNITMSQLKQVIRYMDALNCEYGLLVCPKESFPKRKNGRNVRIGKKEIIILSLEDLDKKFGHKEKVGVPGFEPRTSANSTSSKSQFLEADVLPLKLHALRE